MDEAVLEKIAAGCMDDRDIEYYVQLAGKKATKTDCRALAANVIPILVDQLDSKASKETKTAMKLHELMMQAFDPAACEDPKFGPSILTAVLGTRKQDIIMANADEMLVHPIVVENMLIAMAPAVMRAYGKEFGRDVFGRGPALMPRPSRGPAFGAKEPPASPQPSKKPGGRR